MNKDAERILCESDFMILSTSDEAGFPHSKIISHPILRQSYHSMKFYLSASSQTVKNAHKNSKGSLCVLQSDTYESLLLKGLLTIDAINKYDSISTYLDQYKKVLQYPDPVILCFEIMTLNHIKNTSLTDLHPKLFND
ncbi:pyridoxamine 5'-phosphate oxidase family protein [uncultured Enterococcus sp.]|uniref:pyridoxamine 5'-phosphate oxidase family protein n=1 Tax=uncultured Enterococcus sp. TaxID=167972 RepID=UPI002AA8C440|nr:pyridoxamine 5'-phosphate oxidase family protein [uncultured Enterococcus sp.]